MAPRYTTLYLVTRLQSELDRVFAEATELDAPGWEQSETEPPMDILETETSLVILIEAPGVRATDLTVEARGHFLEISGTRGAASGQPPGTRFHCMERDSSRFRRTLHLPEKIDPRQAVARLKRGVLEIELPKIVDRREQTHSIDIEETTP